MKPESSRFFSFERARLAFNLMRRRATSALVVSFLASGIAILASTSEFNSARAADSDANKREPVKLKSYIVALENYEGARLDYVQSDVEKVGGVLMKDFGSETKVFIDRPVNPDTADNSDSRDKDDFEKRLQDWFDNLGMDDTALLFLSGHGVKDKDGKLYLPMLNFKTAKNPFETAAVPFSWIREKFEESNAKTCLIVVDACYSGTSKDLNSGESMAMARAFNDDGTGVATLASSSENQKSWLWDKTKSSLFTYWFVDGLRGFADKDEDGTLDLDELFDYARIKVENVSSRDVTMAKQTPFLIKGEAFQGFSLPRPVRRSDDTIARGCEALKGRLAEYAQDSGKNRYVLMVAPEFKTSSINATVDARTYGRFPSVLADRFRSTLARRDVDESDSVKSKVRVAGREESLALLEDSGISIRDFGFKANKALLEAGVDATLNGSVEQISKNTAKLTWVLTDLKSGDTLEYSDIFFVTADELATQGASFSLETSGEDANNEYVDTDDGVVPSLEIEAIDEIQTQMEEERNPFDDEDSPFKVAILARPGGSGKKFVEREGAVKDGVYYVPLDKGEEFAIRLTVEEQKYDKYYARVLVDGLGVIEQSTNTFETPENVLGKDLTVEGTNPSIAPRVDLKNARRFILHVPEGSKKSVGRTLDGFIDEKNSVAKRFTIGDVEDSWAARSNYTDKIGLITVMFSNPVPIPKTIPEDEDEVERGHNDIATVPGDEIAIKLRQEMIAGEEETRAVFQIKYVSTKEFKRLFSNQ